MSTWHIKDFEICRQDYEKHSTIGRVSEVKKWTKFEKFKNAPNELLRQFLGILASYIPSCYPKWLVEHLPVSRHARKSNTGAVLASWSPGRKRTQTLFLMTFFQFSRNLTIRLANPIFSEEKYDMRICHLKDFEICRQNFEKRWRIGRSSEVKKWQKKLKVTNFTSEAIFGQLVLHICLPAIRSRQKLRPFLRLRPF